MAEPFLGKSNATKIVDIFMTATCERTLARFKRGEPPIDSEGNVRTWAHRHAPHRPRASRTSRRRTPLMGIPDVPSRGTLASEMDAPRASMRVKLRLARAVAAGGRYPGGHDGFASP